MLCPYEITMDVKTILGSEIFYIPLAIVMKNANNYQ